MTDPEKQKQGIAGLFDRLAPTYDAVGVEYFTAFAQRLVDRVALRPGDAVLDAGCGRGAATFAAAAAVGPEGRVTALDISPGMVERTAADARGRGLGNVDVRVGDAEAPDVEGPLDAVLSALVIFFLPDPTAALTAYRGLLRDSGRLGLTTFPPQPRTRWSAIGQVLERFLPEAVTARPDTGPLASPEALAETLRAVGFAEVTQETETYEATFRDLDHWWEWAWSQGQRFALERVPADRLDEVQAELYDLLRPGAGPDGSLRLPQLVTYTVATA